MMRIAALLALLAAAAACTTLGPMPATTGVSAVPIGRPGADIQAGPIPGFYASRAATGRAGGAPIMHFSALLEPDRWLGIEGVIAGARIFGQSGDTPGEPYLGYRRRAADGVWVGAVAFGSAKRATSRLASYHGVRVGAEGAIDAELWAPASWLAIHAQAAASATRILASGSYCVDDTGVAIDCNEEDPAANRMISGKTVGVFPAATFALAVEAGPREGAFDRARLALIAATGTMPLVVDGSEVDRAPYVTLGLTLSLGFGLGEP